MTTGTIEDSLRSGAPLPARLRGRLLTRQIILDAAAEEITAHGLDGVRLGAVARRAGVSRPTLYAHFPTRDDLLFELDTRAQTRLLVLLRSRLGGGAEGDLVGRLVDAVFDWAEGTPPALRRERMALALRRPDRVAWLGDEAWALVVARFTAARDRGEHDPARDPAQLAQSALSALFGFLAIERAPVVDRRRDARETLARLVGAPAPAVRRARRRGRATGDPQTRAAKRARKETSKPAGGAKSGRAAKSRAPRGRRRT